MNSTVLDASVVMAILLNEPGAQTAQDFLADALCCTVNFTEILTRCFDKGISIDIPQDLLVWHNVQLVDFNKDLAFLASSLRSVTKHNGLSLGDRACLALAIRESATAITTDRAWADLDVGCHIEVIR